MAWSSADFNFDGYIYVYKTKESTKSFYQCECLGDLAYKITYEIYQKTKKYNNVDKTKFLPQEEKVLEQYANCICRGKGTKGKTVKELCPELFTKEDYLKCVAMYKRKYW